MTARPELLLECPQPSPVGQATILFRWRLASCHRSCAKEARDRWSLQIVCGFLKCDARPFNPILVTLPRLLHIERALSREGDGMRPLIDLIVAESHNRRAGSRSVLLRIGELMFVEVVRRHLAAVTAEEGGWLAGLRDPLIGRVLARMHREPQRAWTIDALARETGSSRTVLAERFAQFVGEPPIHYLARWRMQRAAGLLASGTAKVSAVARDVGYDSEAAFSRAFKKHTGVTPATWRDERRTLSQANGPVRLRC